MLALGDKAACLSPEGWNVPTGKTGRSAGGLAQAEGMGKAGEATGAFTPAHLPLTERPSAHTQVSHETI